MVTAVVGVMGIFKEMGLSAAVVQRRDVTHHQVSTLFWINLLACISLGVLVAASAPLLAWFYQEPRVAPITLALAINFAISGLLVQHKALLTRRMRFTAVAAAELFALFCSIVIAIALARRGWGYWSLVAMTLSQTAIFTGAMWVLSDWRPGRPIRGAGVRPMIGFGANLTGFQLLNYFSRNLDNLLIGKFVGETPLGLYVKAYSLLMLPLSQINGPLTAVMVPTLSRLQDQPDRFRRGYLKGVTLSVMFTAPLTAFLFFWSDEVIHLVLGHQWAAAGHLFQILAVAAMLQPLANTTGWLYIPLGRTARLLRWKLMTGWFNPLLMLIGVLHAGVEGVAWAVVISTIVLTIPGIWYASAGTPLRVADVLIVSVRPIAAAVASSAAVAIIFDGHPYRLLGAALVPPLYFGLLCLFSGGFAPLRELMSLIHALHRRDATGLSE